MEAIRADREAAEAAECTFQPKINSKSKQIMEFRTSVCQVCHVTLTNPTGTPTSESCVPNRLNL